jgi:hypothetical protein
VFFIIFATVMDKEPMLPGCYLLIILAEPICEDHKEKILQKVAKGMFSFISS